MGWGCSSVGIIPSENAGDPGFNPQHCIKTHVMMYHNPRIQEVVAVGQKFKFVLG